MILVTGATGLVGSHLLYELVSSGTAVKAIRRKTSNIDIVRKIFNLYHSDGNNLFNKINWIECDLLDYQSLLKTLTNCDYVYHVAAMVSFAPEDKQRMLETNISGTTNIVNACIEKKITKLCYVSSIAALGRTHDNSLINEDTKWEESKKTSSYSRSKYYSELEIWKGIEKGLNTVIVNPTVILGPGNWETGSSALFNTVWKGLKFYTTGITGFVDVRDVASIMIRLMNSDIQSQKFILNSENYCYKNLLSEIADNLNKPRPKFRVTKFIAETAWRLEFIRCKLTRQKPLITKETTAASQKISYYSNEKIKKILQYNFISITDSIRFTCEIFLKDKKKPTL